MNKRFGLAMACVFLFGAIDISLATPPISVDGGVKNERSFLRFLQHEMGGAKKFARVYYAACGQDEKMPIPFPKLRLRSTSTRKASLTAKEAFDGNPQVKVFEDTGNVIRIRIGNPTETLLHVRISKITFSPMQRYNSNLAIGTIMGAKEVQDAMRALNFKLPQVSPTMLLTEPATTNPHLPGIMTNITVDRAMDDVATTFRGVVFYGFCAQQNTVDIGFAPWS